MIEVFLLILLLFVILIGALYTARKKFREWRVEHHKHKHEHI